MIDRVDRLVRWAGSDPGNQVEKVYKTEGRRRCAGRYIIKMITSKSMRFDNIKEIRI